MCFVKVIRKGVSSGILLGVGCFAGCQLVAGIEDRSLESPLLAP